MEISIVIPVYGSPHSLDELNNRLNDVLEVNFQSFEIILVNDGCPQNSWDVVKSLVDKHKNTKGINFSRNFGQHNAITAGLELCKGDEVVVMDCDLQDQPEEIPKLLAERAKGYEVVVLRRVARKDSLLKRLSSKLFHRFLSYMTDTESDEAVANFGVYSRKVIDAYLQINERIRSFPLHVRWLGFSSSTVDGNHAARFEGRSSYTLSKLLGFAFDLIISFSDKPLKLMVGFGFFVSLLASITAVYFLLKWYFFGVSVVGWSSLIVSIWFLGGTMIMMQGVVGIYVAKAFDEAKRRPLYVIDEIIG